MKCLPRKKDKYILVTEPETPKYKIPHYSLRIVSQNLGPILKPIIIELGNSVAKM